MELNLAHEGGGLLPRIMRKSQAGKDRRCGRRALPAGSSLPLFRFGETVGRFPGFPAYDSVVPDNV